MLQSGPLAQALALDDAVALGADAVRAVVRWRDVAPRASSLTRPRRFRPADPAAYEAARWDPLDDLVRGASARGLGVLLSPSTPMPSWASRCAGPPGLRRVCAPDAAQYGAFVRAMGRRYSGTYPDENQDRAVLPAVRRWSFGNEPNLATWLQPQRARRRGVVYVASAVRYRAMVRAAIAGLRATGHRGDQLLLGETSPLGQRSGALATRSTPPAAFIRALLCVDRRGRPLRGAAAAASECRRLPPAGRHRLRAPSLRAGRIACADRARPARAGDHDRLVAAIEAGARRGCAPRADPAPAADPLHGARLPDPPARHDAGRLADTPGGVPEPVRLDRLPRSACPHRRAVQAARRHGAGRLPVGPAVRGRPPEALLRRVPPAALDRAARASRLRVYGQVRPLAARAAARVELQNAPLGAGAFQTIATFSVRSRTNAFLRTIPRFEGRFRLVWTPSGGGPALVSREARIGPG